MVLLKRISDVLEEIECKKVGVHRSLFTLIEKHLCSIQESIGKSSKELKLVRESLNAKREEIEDKEREFLEYVDLKLREEKLYEKEMTVRGKYEELENVIEGKLKEIGLKEKQFQERADELDSREEKLKQQENELKARQEELDSAMLFNKMKLDSVGYNDSTKELAETSSQPSPQACDSRGNSRKREGTTMLLDCKRPKAGKSSEYSKEEKIIGMDGVDKNLSVQQLNTDNAGLAIICSDNIVHDDSEPEPDTDHEGTIQVWDCYDILDGMPRLYARVEKVFTPDKLEMGWLEADAEENHWTNHEL
ncbi:hypothetical protein K7X08_016252 [Anisodus acutangulus]|uniref:DUF3444 domain-containing protein n=1 Tax=Anisodus acutangulus TaxID=402998 RepID=A0A9Q1LG54_9SOLA|nr:hypothetical protein K7X08_016252 [Anisodus acutangulus]